MLIFKFEKYHFIIYTFLHNSFRLSPFTHVIIFMMDFDTLRLKVCNVYTSQLKVAKIKWWRHGKKFTRRTSVNFCLNKNQSLRHKSACSWRNTFIKTHSQPELDLLWPRITKLITLNWDVKASRVQHAMLTCSNTRCTPEDPESSVQHSALCACQQGFWSSFVISIDSGEWQMVIMGAWDRLPLWEWLTSQPSLLPSVPVVWLAIVLCVASTGAKAWWAILSLRSTIRRTPHLLFSLPYAGS